METFPYEKLLRMPQVTFSEMLLDSSWASELIMVNNSSPFPSIFPLRFRNIKAYRDKAVISGR